MQVLKREESKLLGRTMVQISIEGRAGRIKRAEAISMAAEEMKVPAETVALIRLDQQAGKDTVLGTFHIYKSEADKKRVYPEYLALRAMSKDEREKVKAAKKKKKATPAPAPEAKK